MSIFMAIENDEDRSKAERLYDAYKNLMYKEAYAILKNQFFAEDAIHESFVRIIKNLHKIDESDVPRTRSFLVIICRNVSKDIIKANNKLKNSTNLEDYAFSDQLKTEETPLDIVINKDSLEKAVNVINSLDPIYRDVYTLKNVYGYSREEISEMLAINLETVKKRLVRAKAKIIATLGEEASYND